MIDRKALRGQKGYVIITEYFHQYALGITGVNRNNQIIIDKGLPFKYKKDAQAFAKINEIKSYKVKGEENVGYGSLNAKEFNVSFVKTSELDEKYRYYSIVNR